MKQLILFLFCLLSIKSNAQLNNSKYAVPYTDKCPNLVYCTDSLTSPAQFRKKLTKYFSQEINWRKLDGLRGIIVVYVSIDSNGKPCCKGYTNYTTKTNEEVADIWIDKIINAMPLWKPAISNGKPVNTLRPIALYMQVAHRPAFEVNYYYGFHGKLELNMSEEEEMRIHHQDEFRKPQ